MNYKEVAKEAKKIKRALKVVEDRYWKMVQAAMDCDDVKDPVPPLRWTMDDLKKSLDMANSQLFAIEMTAASRGLK